MAHKEIPLVNGYYFKGNLNDKQIALLDKLDNSDVSLRVKDVFQRHAEANGTQSDIVLLDQQCIAVAKQSVARNFFNGDRMGLGKMIMSMGAFANYRLQLYNQCKDFMPEAKAIMFVLNRYIPMCANDAKSCGLRPLVLSGGSLGIERALKRQKESGQDYDIVVTSWTSIQTNAFMKFYIENKNLFSYVIGDETSVLRNDKTQMYDTVLKIRDNSSHTNWLNGTPFECRIEDVFNQFRALNSSIIPYKWILTERYVTYGFNEVRVRGGVRSVPFVESIQYMDELRDRLKYFYISRKSFGVEAPMIPKFVPVEMSAEQALEIKRSAQGYESKLNSPTTSNPNAEFTKKTVPKLEVLIDTLMEINKEKCLIYCINNSAQRRIVEVIKEELGLNFEIISGQDNTSEEDTVRVANALKDGSIDGIVTNIAKSLNIKGVNHMIFYSIPMNPFTTLQAMFRINRDRTADSKFYYFLTYMGSPEANNMEKLAMMREKAGEDFTGQEYKIYQQVVNQIRGYETNNKFKEFVELEDSEDVFKSIA